MAAQYTEEEQRALFASNARRIYRATAFESAEQVRATVTLLVIALEIVCVDIVVFFFFTSRDRMYRPFKHMWGD